MTNNIEFIEDLHIYLVNGEIVPSVTQVIKAVFNDEYKGVPKYVLENKANYGNKIHEWIEHYALTGESEKQTKMMKLSTDQYLEMAKDIQIDKVEQLINYKSLYAGKYDMLGWYKGERALFDIKTTYSLNEEYLQWQLGMYRLALGENIKTYCIWLPKGKLGHIKEILPKNELDIVRMLHVYYSESKKEKTAPF